MSDYRREKAAEMAKEEERKLEDIRDKVVTGKVTIQAQAEQMEAMLESLEKGAEAERQLDTRITDKMAELDEVLQDLADIKSEVHKQKRRLELIKVDADALVKRHSLRKSSSTTLKIFMQMKVSMRTLKRCWNYVMRMSA